MGEHESRQGDVLTNDAAYADVLAAQIKEGTLYLEDLDGEPELQILVQHRPDALGGPDAA